MYVKQDAFHRSAVVSPSSIINIHPTLVRREDFEAEIWAYMTKWSSPESEDATQWLGEHHPEYQ
eukprot:3683731-Ditylum_brightwellii.AAC.1